MLGIRNTNVGLSCGCSNVLFCANVQSKVKTRIQVLIFKVGRQSQRNLIISTHLSLSLSIYIYIYVCMYEETVNKHIALYEISMGYTIVEDNPKAPFSIATTPRCRGGHYSFPGWLYFTLDPHLIMLSVKQGGIMQSFKSQPDFRFVIHLSPAHIPKQI